MSWPPVPDIDIPTIPCVYSFNSNWIKYLPDEFVVFCIIVLTDCVPSQLAVPPLIDQALVLFQLLSVAKSPLVTNSLPKASW